MRSRCASARTNSFTLYHNGLLVWVVHGFSCEGQLLDSVAWGGQNGHSTRQESYFARHDRNVVGKTSSLLVSCLRARPMIAECPLPQCNLLVEVRRCSPHNVHISATLFPVHHPLTRAARGSGSRKQTLQHERARARKIERDPQRTTLRLASSRSIVH